ncbi:MAG: hypothetical protein AAGI90_01910 [Chlamydiota bacterium]
MNRIGTVCDPCRYAKNSGENERLGNKFNYPFLIAHLAGLALTITALWVSQQTGLSREELNAAQIERNHIPESDARNNWNTNCVFMVILSASSMISNLVLHALGKEVVLEARSPNRGGTFSQSICKHITTLGRVFPNYSNDFRVAEQRNKPVFDSTKSSLTRMVVLEYIKHLLIPVMTFAWFGAGSSKYRSDNHQLTFPKWNMSLDFCTRAALITSVMFVGLKLLTPLIRQQVVNGVHTMGRYDPIHQAESVV